VERDQRFFTRISFDIGKDFFFKIYEIVTWLMGRCSHFRHTFLLENSGNLAMTIYDAISDTHNNLGHG
jgi:hypothetical protein